MIELALIFGICLLGIAFAGYLARWVLDCPVGDGEVPRVALRIRQAAELFSRRMRATISAVSAVLGGGIFLAYGLARQTSGVTPLPPLELGVWLTVSFALGVASALAVAHVTSWISTRANVRAASGARKSLDHALQIAIRGGAISGLVSVSLGLLGLGGLFAAVFAAKGGFSADSAAALRLAPQIPFVISGYALGAAFAALLAELAGGTFAKSADVGADLAGKEWVLPEDDATNPATIADLAGDCAGESAGRAASVLASTVAENLGVMMLAAALFRNNDGITSSVSIMLFPLVTRALGVMAAIFGVMVVRTDDREDPMNAIARGLYVTALLFGVGTAGVSKWLLGPHWLPLFGAAVIGIVAGLLLLFVLQYYTEFRHRPVREIAEAARLGPSLALLRGVSVGFEAALAPIFIVADGGGRGAFPWSSNGFVRGRRVWNRRRDDRSAGTSAYVLAGHGFGSIIDSASGIVEMTLARERPDVRGRTVVLDAVGNTTKALTKALASVATVLSTVLLVVAWMGEMQRLHQPPQPDSPPVISWGRPEVYMGAVIGTMLVLWFTARCVSGVSRAARHMFEEARRQRSIGPATTPPDPTACVELASRAAPGQAIVPAHVGAVVPLLVGLGLCFGGTKDNSLIVADAVAALIMAATIAGVLGALLLGNAGGAWDNAKKYIVTGAHGGRYLVDETGARIDNPTYIAAAIGDTVGDPLKDAAGPAIRVLVKMLSIITIVFLPFFL